MARNRGLLAVFATVFAVASAAVASTVTVNSTATADNYFDFYLNGTLAFSSAPNDWKTAETNTLLDVSPPIVIAVKAWNLVPPEPSASNPAAFLAEVNIDGTTYLTDSRWKVFPYADANADGLADPPPNQGSLTWKDVGYDDSAWVSATEIAKNGSQTGNGSVANIWYGANGNSPISGISGDAWWIWDEFNGRYPHWGAPVHTPVYLRLDVVPEPFTMVSAFLAIGCFGMYVRRHTGKKATG